MSKLQSNPSGLPFVKKVDTGADINASLIPIVAKRAFTVNTSVLAKVPTRREFDINWSTSGNVYVYRYPHNVKGRRKIIARWRVNERDTLSASFGLRDWCTLPNKILVDDPNFGAITVHNVTPEYIDIYINLTTLTPILDFEIYFLNVQFDQLASRNS